MSAPTSPSGIPAIGMVRRGTHFCHFYESADDLEEMLVPYFVAGLENNERCLWVVSEPVGAVRAREALAAAYRDLDARIAAGQLQIVEYSDWYMRHRELDVDGALQAWQQYKDDALRNGYQGVRLAGNTAWLQPRDWGAFAEYEAKVDAWVVGQPVIALCSYCIARHRPADVFDVLRTHQFALARQDGAWQLVESASVKRARQELHRLNEELEERVNSRTAALAEALEAKEALLRELNHRIKNNLQVITSLINLKSTSAKHEAVSDAFATTSARLRAMSLVHDMLYGEGALTIDFGEYLQRLARSLVASFGAAERIAIDVRTAPAQLDIDTSITLGLIANEIISNALRHAFPSQRGGRITVNLDERDGGHLLMIGDDGVGLSRQAQAGGESGVGLTLIHALAKKLGSEPRVESEHGTVWTIPLMLQSKVMHKTDTSSRERPVRGLS